VVGVVLVLSDGKMVPDNSWAAPSKSSDKGARKGTKGSKKGQKQCPRWVIVTATSNDKDKEGDIFHEEYVTVTEQDFKH
jgi:hypothetical protein